MENSIDHECDVPFTVLTALSPLYHLIPPKTPQTGTLIFIPTRKWRHREVPRGASRIRTLVPPTGLFRCQEFSMRSFVCTCCGRGGVALCKFITGVNTTRGDSPQGPSCCCFITTPTLPIPSLPSPLAITNPSSVSKIMLFHERYINGIMQCVLF